jgi:hypothetical protein
MKRIEELRDLLSEIDANTEASNALLSAIDELTSRDIPILGRTKTTAVAAAGFLENFYTAAETLFVRINQCFGNGLQSDRWHSDLLRKMTLQVPEVRPPCISQEVYRKLEDLMRFRHFKRYYFQLDYDWQRLDHLIEVVRAVAQPLRRDIAVFRVFVEQVIQELQ